MIHYVHDSNCCLRRIWSKIHNREDMQPLPILTKFLYAYYLRKFCLFSVYSMLCHWNQASEITSFCEILTRVVISHCLRLVVWSTTEHEAPQKSLITLLLYIRLASNSYSRKLCYLTVGQRRAHNDNQSWCFSLPLSRQSMRLHRKIWILYYRMLGWRQIPVQGN